MNIKNNIVHIFTAAFLIAACGADKSNTFKINGYNCEALEAVELEEPLKEISGLAYDVKRNEFLAINDEQGIVFTLDSKTFGIKNKIHFGEKGDYEEIQFSGNTIYVLRSDGTIFKMQYDGKDISAVTTFSYEGSKAEYESFYVSEAANELVLIPKNSKEAKTNKVTTAYVIDATTGKHLSKEGANIDWQRLKNSFMLHPSAVAVQSQTKEIYVLASIEKLLLVLDASGNVRAEYVLPASMFQQPEGITFDENQNMYISNEAAGFSPTIIKIPIQKK
jgi:uncharacterized protein YjiK